MYRALPLKREVFSLVRKFASPPEKVYRHLHFEGPFTVHWGRNKFRMVHYGYQLENALFWEPKGGWERESLRIWSELCTQADCIVDIGANTGVFALLAKTINPKARVIAFEPVARVFQKLVKN